VRQRRERDEGGTKASQIKVRSNGGTREKRSQLVSIVDCDGGLFCKGTSSQDKLNLEHINNGAYGPVVRTNEYHIAFSTSFYSVE
jgi:hypothetical protein